MKPHSPVRISNPKGLYDSSVNGYSHVAEVPAGTRLVFIAGQSGEDENGNIKPDFQAQVARAFHNVRLALESVGGSMQHIAKLTVYIVDHSEAKLPIYGAQLQRAFGVGPLPTCTLVPVTRLALDAMLFEVEAIAALPA